MSAGKTQARPPAMPAYRAAVMTTVLVAVAAAASQGAVPAATAVTAAALIACGFTVSCVRRGRSNTAIKVALAAGLALAFLQFLRSVRGAYSVDEARVPLAGLFIWVQVQHSFDVPRRRDLAFSLSASIALLALAGSLATSSGFGVWAALYAVAGMAALITGHGAELSEASRGAVARPPAPATPRRRRALARSAALIGATTALATAAAFVSLPRLPGTSLSKLQFSGRAASSLDGLTGRIIRPAQSRRGMARGRAQAAVGVDALDLRARGKLSSELLMRVRSPEAAFWRAQVFDHYSDGRWRSTARDPQLVRGGVSGPVRFPLGATPASREVVQTYFIEKDLPNLAFAAAQPSELWTSASSVRVDEFGSIRLPYLLESDTIYSVVSQVGRFTDAQLATAAPDARPDPRFLQLDERLPARVRDLAVRLTASEPTQIGKVRAVERWLMHNTVYRLDAAPDPPGREPLDVFLFDRREGYCEQIATAMAVLLRASGVQTRMVSGFAPGERNPFTGYYDVRDSDAHTWIEAWYPGFGWVEHDPTVVVPFARGRGASWPAGEALARWASGLIPPGLGRLAERSAAPLIGALAAAAGLAAALRRRSRPRLNRVAAAWTLLEEALARRGIERAGAQTALSLTRRCTASTGVDLTQAGELFSRLRYGPEPSEAEIEAFERLVEAAIAKL